LREQEEKKNKYFAPKHALKKHGDMIEKLSDENTNESVNIPEQNLRKNELKDSLTVFHDQKIDDSVDTHAQKSEKRDIEDLSEEVLNQKLKSEKSDEIDQSTDSRGHGKNLPKKIIKRRKRMPKGQNTDSKTREGVCEHCGEVCTGSPEMICFFFNLALTDRNMQVKFGLKGVLEL
jgi:hypothetical protein